MLPLDRRGRVGSAEPESGAALNGEALAPTFGGLQVGRKRSSVRQVARPGAEHRNVARLSCESPELRTALGQGRLRRLIGRR